VSIVIHHNPDCETSRNVLAFIRAARYVPTVILYLETGWTRPQLLALFAAADLTPRAALRTTKSPAMDLGRLIRGSRTRRSWIPCWSTQFWSTGRLFALVKGSGSAARAKLFSTCWTGFRPGHFTRRTVRW